MGAAKKKAGSTSRLSAGFERLAASLRGRGMALVVGGSLVVGLLAGFYVVWERVRPSVLASDAYLVTPKKVEITPLPPWIHTDICGEVFRNASLDDGPLSIMDDNLTERISSAFSLHPWVAKVLRVAKSHPARIEVELVYRRPVCMVEVPGGLFPVDPQGVLLPVDDFSPIEASRYPRLTGVKTVPAGTVGERWGDARVEGGAAIAEVLADVWSELKLAEIIPVSPAQNAVSQECTYSLRTRGGTRIYWGHAPGSSIAGELPVADKLARLRRYFDQYGTLEGDGAPQELDLRSLRISSLPATP